MRFEDLEYWADEQEWAEAETWADDQEWVEPGLAQALRRVMHDDYAGAGDEAYDDALDAVLGGMSAAEGFSFSNALSQISKGAGQVLANPLTAQIATTALPIGAGALGTVIGGPVGTALGSQLGTLAAGALFKPGQPPRPAAAPGPPTATAGIAAPAGPQAPLPGVPAVPLALPGALPGSAAASGSAVAGGSAAAAQGLVATQLPAVMQHLAAAALGQAGARRIDGVPVADVMKMLSAIFGQAAADADELTYLEGESEDGDSVPYQDLALGSGRSLYTTLIDAENRELGL